MPNNTTPRAQMAAVFDLISGATSTELEYFAMFTQATAVPELEAHCLECSHQDYLLENLPRLCKALQVLDAEDAEIEYMHANGQILAGPGVLARVEGSWRDTMIHVSRTGEAEVSMKVVDLLAADHVDSIGMIPAAELHVLLGAVKKYKDYLEVRELE